jgi:hypothetical protein
MELILFYLRSSVFICGFIQPPICVTRPPQTGT